MLGGAIQHLYASELSCDLVMETKKDPATLEVDAREYIHEKTSAVTAKLKISKATEYEKEIPRVEQYLLPLGTKVKESVKTFTFRTFRTSRTFKKNC